MGAGGRAVEPERALEIPRRAFLESRSLPKERFGTPLSATKRWRSPARRLRRSTGFAYSLPLEADSDRLLALPASQPICRKATFSAAAMQVAGASSHSRSPPWTLRFPRPSRTALPASTDSGPSYRGSRGSLRWLGSGTTGETPPSRVTGAQREVNESRRPSSVGDLILCTARGIA